MSGVGALASLECSRNVLIREAERDYHQNARRFEIYSRCYWLPRPSLYTVSTAMPVNRMLQPPWTRRRGSSPGSYKRPMKQPRWPRPSSLKQIPSLPTLHRSYSRLDLHRLPMLLLQRRKQNSAFRYTGNLRYMRVRDSRLIILARTRLG